MTAENVLLPVLLAVATAMCAAAIWALREAVFTARSVRLLTDDLRERLVPLLDKADVTVDAANAELLRIDGAITRFEDAAVRVSDAATTLSDIVQAPAEIVTGVADRFRRAWKERKHNEPPVTDEGSTLAEQPTDEPAPAADASTDTEDPWQTIE